MAEAMVENAAGWPVPARVNERASVPYQGVGGYLPAGRKAAPPIRSCAEFPAHGDKQAPDLAEALRRAGLRDGMVISSHHHFRNGDLLMGQVFAAAAALGVRDLIWLPSATFPCHEPLIADLDRGLIHHIEGSLNGPLGTYASHGRMRGMAVLRSHGSRYRAIQDGDIHVDIAVIAAPAADPFGGCSGVRGPAACGPLGFALADAQYADHVIAVTDHLVPFPCVPWDIQGNYVDQVVVLDRVGDPSKIVSGTTEITRSPDRLLIAEYAARFVRDAGIMRAGFSERAAIENLRRGVLPPASGNDNPQHYDDSAVARAVAIGLFCGGEPERAAALAKYDSQVTNTEDGVYAAQSMAAAIASLAGGTTLATALASARTHLPDDSWIAYGDHVARQCRDEADSPQDLALLLTTRLINSVYSYGNAAPETLPAAFALAEACDADL